MMVTFCGKRNMVIDLCNNQNKEQIVRYLGQPQVGRINGTRKRSKKEELHAVPSGERRANSPLSKTGAAALKQNNRGIWHSQ
jgi:hypothetical protein